MNNPHKRQRRQAEIILRIPLSDGWSTVIMSNGDRFYYDEKSGKSCWQLPEKGAEEAEIRLEEIREYVVVILGIVRGFNYSRYVKKEVVRRVKEMVGGGEDVKNQESRETESTGEQLKGVEVKQPEQSTMDIKSNHEDGSEQSMVEAKNNRQVEPAQSLGLELGYGSSDESAEDRDEEEEEKSLGNTPKQTEEVKESASPTSVPPTSPSSSSSSSSSSSPASPSYALDISDIDELEDADQSASVSEQFLLMLTRKEIDPFSSYDLEVDNLYNEPEFVAIEDDSRRAELFDYWSKKQQQVSPVNQASDESLSPTSQFVDFLSNLDKLPKYYFELKRKYRKETPFKDIALDDKGKEKAFKDYRRSYNR